MVHLLTVPASSDMSTLTFEKLELVTQQTHSILEGVQLMQPIITKTDVGVDNLLSAQESE